MDESINSVNSIKLDWFEKLFAKLSLQDTKQSRAKVCFIILNALFLYFT